MAKTPDNPIDQTRDGSYQVQGPSVTVTPAPVDKSGPTGPPPTWRRVGSPIMVGVDPAPGT
jgi:hypothetical protein